LFKNAKKGRLSHNSRPFHAKDFYFQAGKATSVGTMSVVIGRRLTGRIISGPEGKAYQQYLKDPYSYPAVEQVKNQTSANDCRGSKNDHDS
jgi:hypothetical protein